MTQKKRLLVLAACLISGMTASHAQVPTQASEIKPVEVGASAPNPWIRSPSGERIRLMDALEGRPTVLIFYRGSWCPFCTRQLSSLIDIEEPLRNMGLQIVAVSADSPAKVQTDSDQETQTYLLFSDAEMEAARAFGVAFKVSPEEHSRLMGFGINIEQASGQGHRELPVPSVFIIDQQGKIAFRYFNPDYRVRLPGQELFRAARKIMPMRAQD